MELAGLVHHGYQLDSILKDEIGTNNIDGTNNQQKDQPFDVLQSYILFENRCNKVKKLNPSL